MNKSLNIDWLNGTAVSTYDLNTYSNWYYQVLNGWATYTNIFLNDVTLKMLNLNCLT